MNKTHTHTQVCTHSLPVPVLHRFPTLLQPSIWSYQNNDRALRSEDVIPRDVPPHTQPQTQTQTQTHTHTHTHAHAHTQSHRPSMGVISSGRVRSQAPSAPATRTLAMATNCDRHTHRQTQADMQTGAMANSGGQTRGCEANRARSPLELSAPSVTTSQQAAPRPPPCSHLMSWQLLHHLHNLRDV